MANAWERLRKFEGGVVVETGQVGSAWYRLYSDGWIEQGKSRNVPFTANTSITFPKPFRDTAYILVGLGFSIANVGQQNVTKYTSRFQTSSNTQNCHTYYWYACGYAAD